MSISRVQTADLFGLRSELRLRLDVHLIRPAESVEVVDVERAEVDLKRVEDIGKIDAVRLGALAIDAGVDLRHAHLEAGEESGQLRSLSAFGHRVLNLSVELLESRSVTILDKEFEAADAAETLHGRGREDGHEGLLNSGVLGVERLHDRIRAQVLCFSLVLRLQGDEDDAGIRPVDESIDRQTREGHRALNARLLQCNCRHLANDRFGAIERRRVG